MVINKMTYQSFSHNVQENPDYAMAAKMVENIHVVRTELEYKGEKVVTGMLVKEKVDYEFFRRYFDNNWLQIQACNSFDLNSKDEMIEYNEPSHFEGLFYPFFYGTLIVMSVMAIVGAVYEGCRRKSGKRNHGVTEEEERYGACPLN